MKTILWDFDGVILDSMAIRAWGFKEIFKDYTDDQVRALLNFHNANGGLSRYVKIRYFYENILRKDISNDQVLLYANHFSELMKKELINPENLIQDAVGFIVNNFDKYNFHIVSGSDQNELRFLCQELSLNPYFLSIHGSPTPKKELVSNLLLNHKYSIHNTCLIGDSINDFEAAAFNKISFFGYNNPELKELGQRYINNFGNQVLY